jgi:hypothetical protein
MDVDARLEHVDARAKARNLASRLAESEERLAVSLGERPELREELAEGVHIEGRRRRLGQPLHRRDRRRLRRFGFQAYPHGAAEIGRRTEDPTRNELPDAFARNAEDRCRLFDRVAVHHRRW